MTRVLLFEYAVGSRPGEHALTACSNGQTIAAGGERRKTTVTMTMTMTMRVKVGR
jgi:hypothetical protein